MNLKNFRLAAGIAVIAAGLLLLPSCKQKTRSLEGYMKAAENGGQRRKMDLLSPFSGVVLVARNGETVFRKAYGYEDRTDMVPSRPDAVYPIASLTKQFTAVLVLQQAEAGNLGLDRPVRTYLPQLPAGWADTVTIHQLLSHTGGLPHYDGLTDLLESREQFIDSVFTPVALADLIGRTEPVHPPGTWFEYSSLGYLLLGAVLESVSGASYAALLDSMIIRPLGLGHTGFASNSFMDSTTVPGYAFTRDGGVDILFNKYHGRFRKAEFRDQSTLYSTGGMHSTVDDLLRWSEALRNGELLGPAYGALFLTPNRQGYCYGLVRNGRGLMERNLYAANYSHTGDLDGHSASINLYDDGTTVIHLANIQPLNDSELIHHLYLSAHGLPDTAGAGKLPDLHSNISFRATGGLEAFNNYYREVSKACGYRTYPTANQAADLMLLFEESGDSLLADSMSVLLLDLQPSEALLNATGYRYLSRQDCKKALTYFEAGAERFPGSANVWDSRGDGLMACARYAEAAESYREAVRLGAETDDGNLGIFKRNLEEAMEVLEGRAAPAGPRE